MYREFYEGAFVEPAVIALVLFAGLFAAVVAWAYWPRDRERRLDRLARMPIDGENHNDC